MQNEIVMDNLSKCINFNIINNKSQEVYVINKVVSPSAFQG